MKRALKLMIVLLVFVSACGSDSSGFDPTVPTDTYPYVNRVAPATVNAGDTVSIFGFGFSDAPPLNIVDINGVNVFADTYALLDPPVAGEIEVLTFTAPAGIAAGSYPIYVIVVDNPSNTNISITINP